MGTPFNGTATKEEWNALIRGDAHAFRRIFDAYWPSVYRQVYSRLLNESESQDIVQETFIILWDRRKTLDGLDNPEAYLRGIAKNLLNNYFRQNRHRLALEVISIDRLPDNEAGYIHHAQLDANELAGHIQRCILAMPSTMQQCITLARDHDLSTQEIATRLNLSEQTIKNNISYARQRIRHMLQHLIVLVLAMSAFWTNL